MHDYNGPPIGSHPPRVKWSRDWFGHIISLPENDSFRKDLCFSADVY